MKKTIITFALLAIAGQMWGRTLTPAEALSRALGDAATPAKVNAMAGHATRSVTAALTVTDSVTGTPSLYVIAPEGSEGYVIVSADDVAMPLLGYSDKGTFDPDNMPDNLRWWLGQYNEAISVAVNDGLEMRPDAAAAPTRKNIAPLVTTRWNQDAPYNDDCPILPNGQHGYTGCVATAMAQIVNYHKWPEKGTGSISYTWQYGGKNLSFDFSTVTFKWDQMLDIYGTGATAEQKAAVAELMNACAMGVKMQFTAEQSGAISSDVAPALRDYFSYDKGVYTAIRYNYTSADWEDLVYTELSTNGPVYYAGSGAEGGHAFVCDGYADGYFHFNWGWGGMSDGYFLLNALDPASQGIGGYSTGFNQRQSVVIGVRKPQADSQLPPPNISLMTPITVYPDGKNLVITGPFYNYSAYSMPRTRFQLRLVNDATNDTVVRSFIYPINLEPSTLQVNFKVGLANLAEGTWTGTVGVSYNDVFYPVNPLVGDTGKIRIEVDANGDFIATPIRCGSITFGQVEALSPFYNGKIFGLRATYNYDATEPLYTQLVPFLINSSGRQVTNGLPIEIELAPGEGTVEYVGEFAESVQNGNYYIALYRSVGVNQNATQTNFERLSDPIPVTISSLSWDRSPIVSCSEWEIENADNVDPSKLTITASPQVTLGYFASPVMACIFSDTETTLRPANAITTFYSPNLFIDEKEKKSTVISGDFVAAEPGKTYQVKLFMPDGTTMTQSPKTFKVSDSSAITDIETDGSASQAPAEYFNLQGQRVVNPGPGLYIRRQGDKAEKIVIE